MLFVLDDDLDMASSIYDSIRVIKHVSEVLIINTLPERFFVDKIDICLCFYLETNNTEWLFVYAFICKQSTYNGYVWN